MKKLFPFILLACILLCGCNQKNPNIQLPTQAPAEGGVPETQAPTQSTTETKEEITYPQQLMFAVALPIETDLTNNDETPFIHQSIHLYCQDQEVADRIIVDYLNRQDAYRNAAESGKNTHYQVLYQPMRLDSGIMSLYGQCVQHQGKNHPIVECQTLNYSMMTGEVLTLGSILRDNSAHEKLMDALLFSAESAAEEEQLYHDYPQIIVERFTRDPSFDEDWFFTSTGLAFFFEHYEIAPYTSGIVTLEVLYARLLGIIDDAFFPAEEDLSSGSLYAESVENAKIEDYTQIAEVCISGYSNGILLYSDGLIRDVRIEILSDDPDGFSGSVFAASTLSTGDAVMLTYDLKIDNPILKITYRDGLNVVSNDLYLDSSGTFVLT